ncbi:hypothetical protein ACHAWF_010367 [Thalassiosira exigua]
MKKSPSSSSLRTFLRPHLAGVRSGLSSLAGSPPELWKAYALKFLDSYAYFSFSIVFTLFLSDEFGMSDVRAGAIYGAWGALITVFGLFTGTIIDNLGVAKCLRIGFVLSFLTRVVIFLATSERVLMMCVLGTLPFSNCLGIPVLTVGIRRYTNDGNRGFAFGLFYCVMNVGALVAGPLVDALTIYYNDKEGDGGASADMDAAVGEGEVSRKWAMTANRAIILSGVVANFIAVFVAFSVREIKVEEKNERVDAEPLRPMRSIPCDDNDELPPASNGNGPAVSRFQPLQGSARQILAETAREPNFRRFLLVCLLTLNVRMVFRHLDGTLPKYMVREFGEDAPKGRVYAVNPAMIVVLVPLVTAATTSVDPLVMIHRGTYVSALSVFALALSTSIPACVLFVMTLSIGEAMWSPRLYDYTMSVAREGREGTYMALSAAPLFLAKLPVGLLSGLLLQRYCPEHLEEGEVRHSKTMWLIVGLSTIVSPIMITLLWGYISGGKVESKAGDGTVVHGGELAGGGNEEEECTEAEEVSSESSYQHKPLVANISLPRVRRADSPLP